MKALEALVPKLQDKNYTLTEKAKGYLANKSRRFLLRVFRFARKRYWHKGAYFWRQTRRESWRLLAQVPEWRNRQRTEAE